MEEKHVLLGVILILYTIIVYWFSRFGKNREIGPRRLFLISFFLTPIMGLAFYFSSNERKLNPYTEQNYKCDNCGYTFAEEYDYCPFCEKEGRKHKLKPVNKLMT
jgi:hypothetical protein